MNFENWICPLPLRDYPDIVRGHGSGGRLSAELVEHLFLPAFKNPALLNRGDSSIVTVPQGRLAYSTDSFVVKPLFFPGGSIGELAINGTVNNLAMSGARPLYLSAGFILEEGFAMDSLGRIVGLMAQAALKAGVQIVTGDTKVVERGHADGVYINTSGIGVIADGVRIGPSLAQPGDIVIISGTIGDHGMAVMSAREGLGSEAAIRSDCAPLGALVADLVSVGGIHVLRDPTRGGVASSLNGIAASSGVGILIDEVEVPIEPEVQAACNALSLDPLYVANEGKLLAIVAPEKAEAILDRMYRHEVSERAAIIGRVTDKHPGLVVSNTRMGATRVVPMQLGELLPRIC
jgi:hydrogenase expression/formation protein HypE